MRLSLLPAFSSLLLTAFTLAPLCLAQDAPDTPDRPAAGVPRTGYLRTKLEALPRDANGWLTPDVWKIIEEEAKASPNSNEARVLAERGVYQNYYKTFDKWTAPPPLPVSEGRLRNLPDPPTQPRFEITDPVWPAKPGDAAVCIWEDDKIAAMSIGVDDNNAMDVPYWRQLSKKHNGIPITWNLITCNIDGAVSKGRVVGAGTWKLWQELKAEGFHFCSHSMTHNHSPIPGDGWPGPDWEAAESARMLDANIPGQRTRALAYPGSGVHAFSIMGAGVKNAWRPSLTKYYIAARGAGGKIINQANMVDYFNVAASTGAVPAALTSDNPKLADQNLNNLFAADPSHPYHRQYRGWANVFIHFINNGKDFEKIPFNVAFEKIMAFCDENRERLWTSYFDDIALYSIERDTATITTNEASNDKIVLTLVTKMEPTIYDYPLSVKVRLPDSWKGVSAKQGDKDLPIRFLQHEGAPFALVKIVPDRGQVTLKAGSASVTK